MRTAPLPEICQLRIFPRLRVLGFLLTEVGRGELDERELAAALPAVRRLHIDAHMHASYERDRDNVLRRIARALGPQLELLELSSGIFDPMLLHELQSYVAGDVATGSSRPLL